jgi:hypothetical protein
VEFTINEFDEVWTSDAFKLGDARCWHDRAEEEVNPGEQLYARYLEVENFELGDSFYVPAEYLLGYDEAGEKVLLDASLKVVMSRTWTRTPDFVARKQGRIVPLSSELEGAESA